MSFTNRTQAGRRLAEQLRHWRGEDVVVLGLPRGGVPVAFEVATALAAPLDVIVVRKLGVPFQPELGMGAIGEDGVRILNDEVLRRSKISEADLATVEQQERTELQRRARRFRGERARVPVAGRTAIIIDDGIATGSTARAACRVVRAQGAARVVLAVPVAPRDAVAEIGQDADEVVCLETPRLFFAIGQWYSDFSQTTDAEVVALLDQAQRHAARQAGDRDEEVEIIAGGVRLGGHLSVPEHAPAMVLFAHGSGSSRHSPRNRYVASVLREAGLGTLLLDLLTDAEAADRDNVFNISLLAGRLASATEWAGRQPETQHARLGYFGASTGAAAALRAAADTDVAAVVSRGGRPDLAADRLGEVRAATLLIVGSQDQVVLQLNEQARRQLRCENRLEVVSGAGHLFEERGTLERAAALARDWFTSHLLAAPQATG